VNGLYSDDSTVAPEADAPTVARATVWSALDNWARQIVQLVTFMVIGNIVGPSVFGIMALAILYLMIVRAFVVDGLAEAVIQRTNVERAHFESVFWALAALGMVIALFTYGIGAPAVAALFDQPQLTDIIRALAVIFPVMGASSLMESRLRRLLNFRVLAIRTVLAYGSAAIVGIAAAVGGWGIWSMVVYQVWLGLYDFLSLIVLSRWLPRFAFSGRHLRDLMGFGLNNGGVRVVTFLSRSVDRILIGYFLDVLSLGLFGMARRIVEGASMALTGMMHAVALPAFAKLQDDRPALCRAVYTSTELASLVILPAYIGLAIVAPDLIGALLGPAWSDAALVLQILCLGQAFLQTSYFFGIAIMAVGRADLSLKLQVGTFFLRIVVISFAVQYGLVAVTLADLVVTVLIYPAWVLATQRMIGLDFWHFIRLFRPALVATGTMAAAVLVIGTWPLENASAELRLVTMIPVGVAVYCGTLFVAGRRSLDQARKAFRRGSA
jgi:PST family polysaccharide transporter